MRVATFQSIASRYASTMGRNAEVNLTFGGDVAFTDGRRINIPALPAGTDMTYHQYQVFSGYLDHEVGHVRFTDFSHAKSRNSLKDPVTHYLWNVVEDIREEKKQIAKYPGSEMYLNVLAEHVDKGSATREKDPPNDESKALALFYKECWEGYREVPHNTTGDVDTLWNHPELVQIAALLRRKMPFLSTSRDSLDLAEELRKMFPDSPPDKKNSGKGEDGGKAPGRPGQGQPGQGQPGQGQPGQGQPGQGQPGQGQPGQGQPGQMLNTVLLGAAAAILSKDGDRKEAFQKLVGAILDNAEKGENSKDTNSKPSRARRGWGSCILPPASTERDKIFVPSVKDQSQYTSTRSRLSNEINAVKKMTRVYLQTRTHSSWTRGLTEGKLDLKALHKLKTGEKTIHKALREKQMVDTALLLLVDLSGSMDAELVRSASIVICEATAPIQHLSLSVAGFTATPERVSSRDGRAGRKQPLHIPLFKGFDEPYIKVTGRLGAIKCTGSTPLGCAYGNAYEFIVNRKEKRKVIWIVSDGDPYIETESNQHSEFLLMNRVHKKCKSRGIETMGLGCKSSYAASLELSKYVDSYGEITDATELPREILKGLKGLIR